MTEAFRRDSIATGLSGGLGMSVGPVDTPLGAFLATVGLPAIARDCAVVVNDLRDWAANVPGADTRRFRALGLTAAVHLPILSPEERALTARLNGWIYAFDDLVDGTRDGRLPDAMLEPLVRRCKAVLANRPPGPRVANREGIVAALREIVRDVSAPAPPDALGDFWRASFDKMLDGIVRERHLLAKIAMGEPAPSPAAHLETARYSIGAPHYLATSFILHHRAGDTTLPARLPTLIALALAAADVARLSNDLHTWVREEREGVFNTVRAADAAIARLAPTLPEAARRVDAVRAIERLLGTRCAQVAGLLATTPAPHPDAEAGIGRLVDLIPALYATADFHEFDDGQREFPAPGRLGGER